MVLDRSGKTIYHCKTYEDAKKFLEQCEKFNIEWYSFETTKKHVDYWYEYKQDTCYQIVCDKYLIYGEVSDFTNHNIITYDSEDIIYQPNVCPNCGSNNLFYHNDYNKGLDKAWICEGCGAEGIESYGFIGHYNITVKNEED